jgi:DeoR family deoxyribose operon repressor
MSSIERLTLLDGHLAHQHHLHVKDAALLLKVSEITVRRDIAEHSSNLTILGGYIMKADILSDAARDSEDIERSKLEDAQRHVARRAAAMVCDGDTIFIDQGLTLVLLAESLSSALTITVVCYSLRTAQVLRDKPNVRTVLLGGVYDSSLDSFRDSGNSAVLQRMGINHAFISADGVSTVHGVTCTDADDLFLKQAAIANAVRCHLVIDSNRQGVVAPWRLAEPHDFTSIITDEAR